MPEPTLVEAVTGLQSDLDQLRAVNAYLLAALKVAGEILERNGIERPEIRAALQKAEGN